MYITLLPLFVYVFVHSYLFSWKQGLVSYNVNNTSPSRIHSFILACVPFIQVIIINN